eukprot:3938335-Rhodomonas_salina.1
MSGPGRQPQAGVPGNGGMAHLRKENAVAPTWRGLRLGLLALHGSSGDASAMSERRRVGRGGEEWGTVGRSGRA